MGGSFARISCLSPAPVVVSGAETSSGRSGIEAEKRTVIRRSETESLVYGERKAFDPILCDSRFLLGLGIMYSFKGWCIV